MKFKTRQRGPLWQHTIRIKRLVLQICWLGIFIFFVVGDGLLGDTIFAQEEELAGTNLIKNHNFEQGWTHWARQGGAVAAETCCGQHETPFWGRGTSPYPGAPFWNSNTWDAYVQPNGQFTQLYQWVPVTQSRHYRLSVWLFTNGMTGSVRRYSPALGQYFSCGSTSSTVFVLVSCEFQAEATENQSIILQGDASAPIGKYVVSDDWALTKIIKPPRLTWMPLWLSLPVKYYVDNSGYQTRTDIAATRWNSGVGRPVLQKTTTQSQAKIKFTASYLGATVVQYFAGTSSPVNGVVVIDVNRSFLDAWIDPPYRYGFEARESILGHEFEHALGLDHTGESCNMLATDGTVLAWMCSTSSPTWGDITKIQNLYPQ